MKILHICYAGAYNEGWSYQENMLSKYHAKMGHEVALLCIPYEQSEGKLRRASETDYTNADGVHVTRMEERFNLANRLVSYRGTKRKLEEISPDIIFVHGCQFLDAPVVARYVKAHPGVQMYVDNHADFSNSATNWLSKNILHKIIWRYCAHKIEPFTRKFYGVLPARVDFLKDIYKLPPEKCELLVMGADDEYVAAAAKPEVRQQVRQQYGIREDDFLVMTGGKIDRWKTQTLLLMEAVKKTRCPGVKLIVFGSVTEELQEQVQALADGEKVQYIGWIQAKDSYRYFAAADLVVFPGRHSVFWEQAAAQGIPMLVKDWPGTHHVDLGGNVEFLTQDRAEEIQTKIESLASHPEKYQRMKEIAQEKGMKVFSYMEIANRAIRL